MKIKFKFITITILAVFIHLSLKASSETLSYLNNFRGLNGSHAIIANNNLLIDNKYSKGSIITDTFNLSNIKFAINVHLANLHNKEGKPYKVKYDSGKTKSITNPEWGVVWNYYDMDNYYIFKAKSENTNLYDLLDQRIMTIEIIKMENGNEKIIYKTKIDKGVDMECGFNAVSIVYDGKETKISIGNKIPMEITTIKNINYNNHSRLGIYTGPGAKIALKKITINSMPIMNKILTTNWDENSIFQRIKSSKDVYEGIWELYDRNLDEKKLRMGGKYRVAIIGSAKDGYDIIYMEGAKVNCDAWKCGMLKGRLIPTAFDNNYNLLWYDSMMKPLNDDSYAIFENDLLINMSFPTERSQIRFVKDIK